MKKRKGSIVVWWALTFPIFFVSIRYKLLQVADSTKAKIYSRKPFSLNSLICWRTWSHFRGFHVLLCCASSSPLVTILGQLSLGIYLTRATTSTHWRHWLSISSKILLNSAGSLISWRAADITFSDVEIYNLPAVSVLFFFIVASGKAFGSTSWAHPRLSGINIVRWLFEDMVEGYMKQWHIHHLLYTRSLNRGKAGIACTLGKAMLPASKLASISWTGSKLIRAEFATWVDGVLV